MASYFSISFFACILPVVVLAYAIVPKRVRWALLLAASYLFIFYLSKWLIVFVWASTLSVYALARWIGYLYGVRNQEVKQVKRAQKKEIRARYKNKARWVLVLAILLNVGILVALKYLGFFGSVLSWAFAPFGVEVSLPTIGISFYTLMAISYMVDVYREKAPADKNLGRVALYLSFFPQIMEGPISRYGETANALMQGNPLTRAGLYAGTLRILVGFAKKLIVADRLDPFVGAVFDSYQNYDGGIIVLAAVLYTFQLYCDFAGTIDVAVGMGTLFNVELPENFSQPFFSKTTSEFWQRWHITLGSWLKDYVFYPVSFSKMCKNLSTKARKRFGRQVGPLLVSSIALFCVWFGNGLWHGAGSQYLAFGMYYFVLIVGGGFMELGAQRAVAAGRLNRETTPYKAFRIARTLCLVFLGEMIFRSNSVQDALAMIVRIGQTFTLNGIASGVPLHMGVDGMSLDAHDFLIAALGIVIVLVFDAVKEHGIPVLSRIAAQGTFVRWAVWIALLAIVVVFSAYGYGYVPVDPMYAQF